MEVLDRYFGNVCELDIIFNFHKVCGVVRKIVLVGVLSRVWFVKLKYSGVRSVIQHWQYPVLAVLAVLYGGIVAMVAWWYGGHGGQHKPTRTLVLYGGMVSMVAWWCSGQHEPTRTFTITERSWKASMHA